MPVEIGPYNIGGTWTQGDEGHGDWGISWETKIISQDQDEARANLTALQRSEYIRSPTVDITSVLDGNTMDNLVGIRLRGYDARLDTSFPPPGPAPFGELHGLVYSADVLVASGSVTLPQYANPTGAYVDVGGPADLLGLTDPATELDPTQFAIGLYIQNSQASSRSFNVDALYFSLFFTFPTAVAQSMSRVRTGVAIGVSI